MSDRAAATVVRATQENTRLDGATRSGPPPPLSVMLPSPLERTKAARGFTAKRVLHSRHPQRGVALGRTAATLHTCTCVTASCSTHTTPARRRSVCAGHAGLGEMCAYPRRGTPCIQKSAKIAAADVYGIATIKAVDSQPPFGQLALAHVRLEALSRQQHHRPAPSVQAQASAIWPDAARVFSHLCRRSAIAVRAASFDTPAPLRRQSACRRKP